MLGGGAEDVAQPGGGRNARCGSSTRIRGKTKTGYLWTMARDERAWCGADPPGVEYRYAPSRGGEQGEKLLAGFSGTAQVDGYPGYNRWAGHSARAGR